MLKILILEFKKLRVSLIVASVIGVLFSGFILLPYLEGWTFYSNLELWGESSQVFNLVYPLFIALPIMWLMYAERKNGFIRYTQTRVSRRTYIFSKWLFSSLAGGLIVFIISISGLFISLFVIEDMHSIYAPELWNFYLGNIFMNHPLLFGIGLSVWRFVLGFLLSSFGFLLSCYVNNIFIILSGPFVYTILENFILSVLGVPAYRLVTSFYPHSLFEGVSHVTMLIGPVILLVFTFMVWGFYKFIKQDRVIEP